MLRFALLTSAEIVARSALPPAGVTSEKMSLHFRPVENSLADLRMGAHDNGTRCATCHGTQQTCLGHEGHIAFAAPLPHPLFPRDPPRLLMLACIACGRARVPRAAWAHGAVVARALRAPAATLVEEALALHDCAHCGAALPRRITRAADGVDFSVVYHTKSAPKRAPKRAQGAFWSETVREHDDVASEADALLSAAADDAYSGDEGPDDDEGRAARRYEREKENKRKNKRGADDADVEALLGATKSRHAKGAHTVGGDALAALLENYDAAWARATLDVERPAALVMTALSVPPPAVRPTLIAADSDDTSRSSDALTTLLVRIVKANGVLRERLETLAPSSLVREAHAQLFCAVAEFYDSTARKGAAPTARSGAATHAESDLAMAVRQRLSAKGGRFRGNLNAKRCDHTARAVISGDATLDLDELGVPEAIANKMTFPLRVHARNVDDLRARVERGAFVRDGAFSIIEHWGTADQRIERLEGLTPEMLRALARALTSAHVVECHLRDGLGVILNRQPSLHKASMMRHRVRILRGATFRINLSVTTPYNADFDGDEMNMHVPQSLECDADAELAAVHAQILSPASNKPGIACVQETLTGPALLTRRDVFFDRADAMDVLTALAFSFAGRDGFARASDGADDGGARELRLPVPAILAPRALWTGKQLFSCALPYARLAALDAYANPLERYECTTARCLDGDGATARECAMDADDTRVLILRGELLRGELDKTVLGASAHSLIDVVARASTRVCAEFIADAQRVATRYLDLASFSIGVADIVAPPALARASRAAIGDVLSRTDALVARVEQGDMPVDAFEREMQALCESTRYVAAKAVAALVPRSNGLRVTAESGAKGTLVNLVQVMACVGQQSVDGRRIAPSARDRTLPHFHRFDASARARGHVARSFADGLAPHEFWAHAQGGREGVTDTAMKTSKIGYLARKFVKYQEDLRVHYDGTVRDAERRVVEFAYGEDGRDGTRVTRQPLDLLSSAPCALTVGAHYDLVRAAEEAALGDAATAAHVGDVFVALADEARALARARATLLQALGDARTAVLALPLAEALAEARRRAAQRGTTAARGKRAHATPVVAASYVMRARRALAQRVGAPACALSAGEAPGLGDFCAVETETMAGAALLSQLATRRVMCEYALDRASFDELLAHLADAWARSAVDAGEMVGTLAAQSISAPCTQLTFNTFHLAGTGSHTVTTGIPRVEELVSLPRRVKTPCASMRLAPEHDADAIARALTFATLGDLVERAEIYYDASSAPEHTAVVDDREWLDIYLRSGGLEESFGADATPEAYARAPWLLRLVCGARRVRARTPRSRALGAEPFTGGAIARRVRAACARLAPKHCAAVLYSHGDAARDEDIVVHVRLCARAHDAYATLDEMRALERALASTEMCGVRGVTGTQFDARTRLFTVHGDVSFETLLETTLVLGAPAHTLVPNDPREAERVLGIEAARAVLAREVASVLNDSSYVNARHLMLLADAMAQRGELTPVSRDGIAKMGRSPLTLASFEKQVPHLCAAALHGTADPLESVSARIILGKTARVGTHACDVLLDEAALALVSADDASNPWVAALDDAPLEDFLRAEASWADTTYLAACPATPTPIACGDDAPLTPFFSGAEMLDAPLDACPGSPSGESWWLSDAMDVAPPFNLEDFSLAPAPLDTSQFMQADAPAPEYDPAGARTLVFASAPAYDPAHFSAACARQAHEGERAAKRRQIH
jgi:DNA-directed RNA polymerase II subunit RPB1